MNGGCVCEVGFAWRRQSVTAAQTDACEQEQCGAAAVGVTLARDVTCRGGVEWRREDCIE